MEIQIRSVSDPFDSPEAVGAAVSILTTADAMGLLEGLGPVERLDLPTFTRVVERIAQAGIGQELHAALASRRRPSNPQLYALLRRLEGALEASPVPNSEWERLERLFGTERLAALVGVSPASVRRYRAGTRSTPDVVAARLHFVAIVVGDLAGAYNDRGIRRWFERSRAQLAGRSPAELLRGRWGPDDEGPRRVHRLARSLTASPAT